MKSVHVPKFCFNYIFVARNIANKHFSLKKAPDPGLKHLGRHDFADGVTYWGNALLWGAIVKVKSEK